MNNAMDFVQNKSVKSLILASMLALSMNGVYAANEAPVPKVSENNISPKATKTPSVDYSYNLVKVQEGGEKPSEPNIVTKFTYNSELKTMVPTYYRIELKQSSYGKGDSAKYYGWVSDEYDNTSLVEVGEAEADIIANYDTSNQKDSIYLSSDNETYKDTGIIGNFIDKTSSSYSKAIYSNNSTISSIAGDFVGNSAKYDGAAIYTYNSEIGSISANFIGNSSNDSGGAIYNYGSEIGSISANFIGNFAERSGGAIANPYDDCIIGNITGDFIGNTAGSDGGAIDNGGDIDSISGNFIGNYAESGGGAIANSGNIGNITGNFLSNQAGTGGAISAYINEPVDFINISSSVFTSNKASIGGAITYNKSPDIYYNAGDISDNLNIDNSVFNFNNAYYGGAIAISLNSYNDIPLSKTFNHGVSISNSLFESNNANLGGAIYLSKDPTLSRPGPQALIDGEKKSNFNDLASAYDKNLGYDLKISNSVFKSNSASEGGAIAVSKYEPAGRVARANSVEPFELRADIVRTHFLIKDTNGETIKDLGYYYQPQIQLQNINTNPVHILIKDSLFENNIAYDYKALGGAISIRDDGKHNYEIVDSEMIISTEDKPEDISLDEWLAGMDEYISYQGYFSKDMLDEYGYGAIIDPSSDNHNALELVNTSFINNKAVSYGDYYDPARGGAIYSTSNIKVTADNGLSLFSGNQVVTPGQEEGTYTVDNEAIFLDNNSIYEFDFNEIPRINLTLEAKNNGLVQFDDKINGSYSYNLHITGDKTGVVRLNNDVKAEYPIMVSSLDVEDEPQNSMPVYIDLEKTTLHLGTRDNVLDNNNLTLNSGTINMVNNQVGVSSLNNLTVNGDTNMIADVDLAKSEMDRFVSKSYGEQSTVTQTSDNLNPSNHKGILHVTGFNMLSDAPEGQDVTEIYFAQIGLKDNVVNGVKETPTSYQTTAYTPIYKYNVMYDNREDAGYFLFTKGDKVFTPGGGTENTGNPSDAYNPSVLATPVAAQVGAYAAQNAAFNYAFQHADTFMPLPSNERFSLRNSDKYAITSYDNLSLANNDFHEKAIWVRPYTSFENIPLKNGPKVDTITYGTLVGGDSSFKELRNGWGTVFTGYVGYNGSSQSYSGVNTYQNGGLIGTTQTFYKGNFFTALTASAGASAGESHNMYGHENFSTLMAGIASKSGYNIEFKDGKYIIQPTMLLSYSFINTFDYRNSASVKINSDPLHAIQLNPNVRFIANLKNGWQPYASVGMVWNILDDTKVMANDVRLPEMSIKPYVEYGLGVQKRWKDKYTGYVQAMIRNGGRNGVSLTGGFRWALGKEGKPIEKVQTKTNKTAQVTNTTNGRKIIKQLSQAQRTALGAKPQNTTRTTNVGVLKQL